MGNRQKEYEATTFNMNMKLKTKAKMFVARENQLVREGVKKDKTNLGRLLNDALDYYLSDVQFEGVESDRAE